MPATKFRPTRPLRFMVLVNAQRGNARRFVEGMLRYSHEREPVEFLMGGDWPNPENDPHVQGIIYEHGRSDFVKNLLATGKPAVALSDVSHPDAYRVICDDYAIGRMGFEHLRELGLQHFAYFGLSRAEFSYHRLVGFREAAQVSGFQVEMPSDQPLWGTQEKTILRKWLKKLPKPVGLMTSVMERGEQIIRICHEANLVVPDQVAVLTVDDDELACQMVFPSLSTIETGAQQIGYLAVELLAKLVRGEHPQEKTIVVPPGELIIRQSTDMLAIEDPLLNSAVRFIRQHACDGIHVSDVLQRVPMSRRSLECAFTRTLNRTVHDEILRIRLGRARQLLHSTDLSLAHICAKTAFTSASVFCIIFRRETGLTPMAYRRKMRRR